MSITATLEATSTVIKLCAGAAVGVLGMFAVAVTYNVVFDNPAIVRSEAKKCAAEKDQMVSRASADAIAALLVRERQMRLAEATSAEAARRRADATAVALAAANDRAKMLEDAARRAGMPTPTDEELEWLGNH